MAVQAAAAPAINLHQFNNSPASPPFLIPHGLPSVADKGWYERTGKARLKKVLT